MHILKQKNPDAKDKKVFKDKTKVPWNIYNAKETGSYMKKFHIIHYRLKYKYLVPALLLMRKMFKKQLEQPIPDEFYNKDIKIFDEAFEEAIKTWIETYWATSRGKKIFATKEECENQYIKKPSYSVMGLRTMKQASVMMALNDTAYREFLTVLVHKIAQRTLKEYAGQEVHHLIYNSKDTYDTFYYVIAKEMQANGPIITLRPARPNDYIRTDDIRIFLKGACSEALQDLLVRNDEKKT